MAETYGVKPKLFTKEWWPYFWMYYKWITIGIATAVVVIAVTVAQCATREKYDLTVTYAGLGMFSQDSLAELEKVIEEKAEDADGNGEINVFVQQFNFENTSGGFEIDYGLQTKHDIELTDEITNLYLYDKYELDMMLGRDQASLIYMDVNKWLESEIDTDRLVYSGDGVPCAVNLSGSAMLEGVEMDTSDIYVVVKDNSKDTDLAQRSLRGAIAAANEMVK